MDKAKRWRRALMIAVAALLLAQGAGTAAGGAGYVRHDAVPARNPAGFYPSNRYTQPEQPASPIAPRFTTDGYERIACDGNLELYARDESLAFLVKDTRSGYIWSSTPSPADYDPKDFNEMWLSKLHSPVVIEYIDSQTAIESEATLKTRGGRVAGKENIAGGVRYSVYLEDVKLGFELEVTLQQGALVVRIPDEGIREDGDKKIMTLQVFPFFGAVPGGKVPGYIFVPDGAGALIRFRDAHPYYEEPYVAPVYGEDYAVTYYNMQYMRRGVASPVFGMVHGAGQHGWLGIIEDGKYDAEVFASPSGVNTPLNAVSARFIFRHAFFMPTSKSGSGINTYQQQRIACDRQVRYLFLTGDEADYCGMAAAYRQYLSKRGGLPGKRPAGNIPLNLTLLGAEQEPGLLWKNLVVMTDYARAGEIVRDLTQAGVSNISVLYNGWNRGGFFGDFRYKTQPEGALGGGDGLRDFIRLARGMGHRVFLYREYDWFTDGAAGLSPRSHAVRLIGGGITRFGDEGDYLSIYYLNPAVAAERAKADSGPFNARLGGPGAAVNGMFLLSDFNERRSLTREQAARRKLEMYAALASEDGLASFLPNEYLWGSVTDAVDVSMFNSQYVYFTDTVPFQQMVMHGRINYYTDMLNLAADSGELMLRAIDYGAYPSFYITGEPAWKLQYTESNGLFTSEYAVWKDEIVRVYETMNSVLARVAGEEITGRKVFMDGVVGTSYSNGVTVYVNYTGAQVSVDGVAVPARGFAVK